MSTSRECEASEGRHVSESGGSVCVGESEQGEREWGNGEEWEGECAWAV